MANDSIFLTAEEATTLQEAVGRIVDTGLRIQDAVRRFPDGAGEAITGSVPGDGGTSNPMPPGFESPFPQQSD